MSQKSTILIVDDEPIGRQLIDAILYKEGYNLEFAENGREAFDKAKALNPDLILMDVMMPEIDGFEVCQMLRADEEMVNVPIILVTALDDIDSRIRGLEAGADDYISKPFDRLELLARIKIITRLNRYRKNESELGGTIQPTSVSAAISSELLNSLVNEINNINSDITDVFNKSFISSIYSNIQNIGLYGVDKSSSKSHLYLCGSKIDTNESLVGLYISNILAKSKPGKIVSDLKNAVRALKTSLFPGADKIKPYCSIIEFDSDSMSLFFTGINSAILLVKENNVELAKGNDIDLVKYDENDNVATNTFKVNHGDKIIALSGLLINENEFIDKLKSSLSENIDGDIDTLKNTLTKVFQDNSDMDKKIGNIIFAGIII